VQLPENGDFQIGPVRLPEGRRTLARRFGHAPTPPVAWVTLTPVPDPGGVWAELSKASPHTGIVPFIARPVWDEPRRPWDDGTTPPDDYFNFPANLAEVDQIDPAVRQRDRWVRNTWLPTEEEEPNPWRREEAWAEIAPYAQDFPGLAPAVDESLDPALRCLPTVCAHLPPASPAICPE
jgi:hypothetical protein